MIIAITILFILLISESMASEKSIHILYNERPPYLISGKKDGEVVGIIGKRVSNLLIKAGVSYRWRKIPSKRQMDMLKRNKSKVCLAGWYKNKVREKFASYTKAIYQDREVVAITRTNLKSIWSTKTIDEILNNNKLILLTKDGYSYGKKIDKLLSLNKTKRLSVIGENINMFNMIADARADYMFSSEEEALHAIKGIKKLKIKYFSNSYPGEKRYILCSFKVDKAIIKKINSFINE